MGSTNAAGRDTAELHEKTRVRLRAAGQSYTSKRRALVEIFDASEQPMSMPEVLAANGDLAQSSVYRNLTVLEQAGVVHRLVTPDEFARYELAEALSGHHHHHLICSDCGSVQDVTLSASLEDSVNSELDSVAAARGFVPTSHQMDLIGICANCQ